MSQTIIQPIVLLIFLLIIHESQEIWPPEYQLHLNDSETFIISDSFDEGYEDVIDDEEMIKENEIKKYEKVKQDWEKYYRIHQFAAAKNQNSDLKNLKNIIKKSYNVKFKERPFEELDYPAYGRFVNNNIKNNFESEIIYYSNEMMKSLIEDKINEAKKKRQNAEEAQTETNLNYNELKNDYLVEVEKEKKSNDTLKFVDVPEEESPKEAVKNIIVFKKPKNCTKEEMMGFGLAAAQCFIQDVKNVHNFENAKLFFQRLLRLFIIWFSIYLIIAIPCWCCRGWCCCCFRCRFCKPRRVIDEAKFYLVENPIGVLHTETNERITYKPTEYEKYAQKQLELEILRL